MKTKPFTWALPGTVNQEEIDQYLTDGAGLSEKFSESGTAKI